MNFLNKMGLYTKTDVESAYDKIGELKLENERLVDEVVNLDMKLDKLEQEKSTETIDNKPKRVRTPKKNSKIIKKPGFRAASVRVMAEKDRRKAELKYVEHMEKALENPPMENMRGSVPIVGESGEMVMKGINSVQEAKDLLKSVRERRIRLYLGS